MSAREPWTKRRAQRQELGEASPGGAPSSTRPMTAGHRCDRCGAQAYVLVFLPGYRELLFCAHHYRQHAPALAKVALEIRDETERLSREMNGPGHEAETTPG
jgi:hypothetical protein